MTPVEPCGRSMVMVHRFRKGVATKHALIAGRAGLLLLHATVSGKFGAPAQAELKLNWWGVEHMCLSMHASVPHCLTSS